MTVTPSLFRGGSFTARTLGILLACAIPFGVLRAQQSAEHVYKARLMGSLGPAQEKWIVDAVLGRAPDAIISLDLALAQGKIRTRYPLDASGLNQELAPHGIQLELSSSEGSGDPSMHQRLATDFPVLVHTGNPIADEADYEQRKQAWLAAHPDLQPYSVATP
jgi:predicted outer membrane lipoprotein